MSDDYQRIKVITGTARRRYWPTEQKLRIIEHSFEPGEVPRLFPDTRMAIFNTYGHSVANPRFRVFIPTKTTMTPEVYEVIWDQIGNKLEDAGYHVGKVKKASGARSGLDLSKRTPTSLFYLPCQAQDQKESFFEEYNEGRKPLDPAEWIENSVFDFDSFEDWETENEKEGREPDLVQIEAAKAEWRATPKGMGNDASLRSPYV